MSASIFAPHHLVEVTYPCSDLLAEEDETGVYLSFNIANRYAPRPLIDHPVVKAATSRDEWENARIVTVNPVDDPNPEVQLSSEDLSDQERFMGDMKTLTSCVGTTRLRVLTVGKIVEANVVDGQHTIRIERESMIPNEDSTYETYFHTYNISHRDFLQGRTMAPWWRILLDVLSGYSDRSLRHLSATREADGFEPTNWEDWGEWLPARVPDWTNVTEEVTTAVSEEEKKELASDDCCPHCRTPWSEDDSKIIRTKCSHFWHLECLATWVMAPQCGPTSRCLCRKLLFTPEETQQLVFGENKEGEYLKSNNPGYSDWENMERSFGDLDLKAASADGQERLAATSDLAEAAWTHVVKHAYYEPQNLTPSHLNPVHFEEFVLFDQTMRKAIRKIQPAMTRNHCRYLVHRTTNAAMVDAFMKGCRKGLSVSEEELANLQKHMTFGNIIPFRPGFMQTLTLLLNRALGIMQHRKCKCDIRGLHEHGECRVYWNPDPKEPPKQLGEESDKKTEATLGCMEDKNESVVKNQE